MTHPQRGIPPLVRPTRQSPYILRHVLKDRSVRYIWCAKNPMNSLYELDPAGTERWWAGLATIGLEPHVSATAVFPSRQR